MIRARRHRLDARLALSSNCRVHAHAGAASALGRWPFLAPARAAGARVAPQPSRPAARALSRASHESRSWGYARRHLRWPRCALPCFLCHGVCGQKACETRGATFIGSSCGLWVALPPCHAQVIESYAMRRSLQNQTSSSGLNSQKDSPGHTFKKEIRRRRTQVAVAVRVEPSGRAQCRRRRRRRLAPPLSPLAASGCL